MSQLTIILWYDLQLMAAAVIVSDKREVRAGYSSVMYCMFVADSTQYRSRMEAILFLVYVCGTLFPSN